MTSKTMLSVERELLAKLIEEGRISEISDAEWKELRALLVKPEDMPDRYADRDYCVALEQERDYLREQLNKPATQHQGEPVTDDQLIETARKAALNSTHRYSYMPATQEDASSWLPHRWVVEAMRDAVSAEQPAPVAVVMPEKQSVPEPEDYNTNIDEVAFAEGYNDALDDVARLNGVKP